MPITNADSTYKFLHWMLEQKGDVNHSIPLSTLMNEVSQEESSRKDVKSAMVDVQVMRKRIKRILEKPVEVLSQSFSMNQIIQLHFLLTLPVTEELRAELEKFGTLQLGATRKTILAYHSNDGTFIRTGNGWEDIQISSNSTLANSFSLSDAQPVKEDMAYIPPDHRPQNLERTPEMGYQSHQNGSTQRESPLQPSHGSAQRDMLTPKQESFNSGEPGHRPHQNHSYGSLRGSVPTPPRHASVHKDMGYIPKEQPQSSGGSMNTLHQHHSNGSLQRHGAFSPDHRYAHRDMHTPKEEPRSLGGSTRMHQKSPNGFLQGGVPLPPDQGSAYGENSNGSTHMSQQNHQSTFIQGGSPIPQGLISSLELMTHLHNLILVLKSPSLDSIDTQIVMERNNPNRQSCVVTMEAFMTSVKQCLGVLRGGAFMYNSSNRVAMQYELFMNLFKFFLLTIGAPVNDPAVIEVGEEIEKCKNTSSMVFIEVRKVECVLMSLFHTATPAVNAI